MGAPDQNRMIKLADGTELECLDEFEADFFVDDVGQYFDFALELKPGATVIDVGANIGLFSAEVCRRTSGDVNIYAFEAVPKIAAVLERNARTLSGRVEIFSFGLGSKQEAVEFSFFPMMSVLSSAHRGSGDIVSERNRVTASLLALIRSGRVYPALAMLPEEMLTAYVDSVMRSRFKVEKCQTELRRFSDVLRTLSVDTVDLLKIDVEGAELDVLSGIDDADWPKIRQILLEVESAADRLQQVDALLKARGFVTEVQQDEAQSVGNYALIFGRRP